VPWHDRQVTTVLQYLVIAGVIGLVVFALAVFVFGRGEQMAPLSPRVSPTELPDHDMSAEDVRRVRFAMALRGYRMSDVDWALDRMADEGMKGDLDDGARRCGLILDVGGYHKNVITLAPSLHISREEIDLALKLLDQLLRRCTQG